MSDSGSSSSDDVKEINLNAKVRTIKNTRNFVSVILPTLPFFFLFFYIFILFLSNLRINSGINRAFQRSPNSLVFKIDRRPKIISPNHIPTVKYDHSRKQISQSETEQFYTQEDIKDIAIDIEQYNERLPPSFPKEDKLEKIVQQYDEEVLSAFDSYN